MQDGGLALEMVNLKGLGFTLPREMVQPALDAFSAQLTQDYPMNIKADDVQVTDTGVTARFSTKNASIPAGNDDPCFAGLSLGQSVQHRAGAGQPEPGSACGQHGDGIVGGADATAGLDPDPGSDGVRHQFDRAGCRAAAGMKSGGRLHEVSAFVGGDSADRRQGLLACQVQQGGRFDDHLEHRVGNGCADGGDVGAHRFEITGHGGADVDDHVDLVGARGNGLRGLGGLDRRKALA